MKSPLPRTLAALVLATIAGPLAAEPRNEARQPLVANWGARSAEWTAASVTGPLRLPDSAGTARDPWFTSDGIYAERSRRLDGLARVEKPGVACWDPTSGALYASANGSLVRLDGPDRLLAVADDVQGTDVDVRQGAGTIVSREPDDTIVVRGFGAATTDRRALLRGPQYFHPSFDATGSRLLVHESRAEGGRVVVLDVDSGKRLRDFQGYGATWHPDGRRIFFSRVEHDAVRVTAAELWQIDVGTGVESALTRSPGVAEIEPAVSPDGRWLLFVDALTSEIAVARCPAAVEVSR